MARALLPSPSNAPAARASVPFRAKMMGWTMSQLNFSMSARPAARPRAAYAYNPRAMLAARASRLPRSDWGTISAALVVASSVFLIVWLV